MKLKAIAGLAMISSTLLLGSCSSDADSSGIEYMPDMYRSPAIEPYVDYGEIRGRENKELKMKLSALVPPHGTIAYRGTNEEEVSLMLPYHRLPNIAFKTTHGLTNVDFTTEDTYLLAAADLNPLKLTSENQEATFTKGKDLFKANCMHCHGEKGDGQGQMMKNATFAGVPDYKTKNELSDGQMFYSIYYGKGAMGSHSSIVNKKEIWTLVHYIRKLQNPDYGSALVSTTAVAAKVEEVTDWKSVSPTSMKGKHLKLDVLFASGSEKIDEGKSLTELNAILAFLRANPDAKVELAGHTDSAGEDVANMTLAQGRSNAVKAWLVKNGVDATRLTAKGYGESQLVLKADGTEDAAACRRIELIIQ